MSNLPVCVSAVAAVLLAAVSAKQVQDHNTAAQWWWLAGMALPVIALLVYRIRGASFHAGWTIAGRWQDPALVVAIFAVALAVRIPQITASPPFLHGDEAMSGLVGRLVLKGQYPLLSFPLWGLPTFSFATSAFGLYAFGDTLFGLRVINALIGSLGVVFTYLLANELLGKRTGVIAAIILAFNFVHADLSRDGIQYIQGPTVITLNLLLVTLWIKRGSTLLAVVAGLFISLEAQVYWSARAGVIPLAVLALYFVVGQFDLVRARWREVAWFGVGLVTSGLPLVMLYGTDVSAFGRHQTEVSILSGTHNVQSLLTSTYGTDALTSVIPRQAWRMITTLFVTGDSSPQIGWTGSILDWISAALLPAACSLVVFRWRSWSHAVCGAWLFAVLAAALSP